MRPVSDQSDIEIIRRDRGFRRGRWRCQKSLAVVDVPFETLVVGESWNALTSETRRDDSGVWGARDVQK